MKTIGNILSGIIFLCISLTLTGQQKGYYRYPAIHGNDIVFTAEGDLWRYNLTTGNVVRLTTSHGVESHASISADGKSIAFIGQYDGPSEVYVMPFQGGTPKRITFDEGNPVVCQWTSDNSLLYSTLSYSTLPNAQLVRLNPATLASEIIPLSQADQGTYLPTGELIFTRLRKQSSFTKRYKGGTAQVLWKYDGKNEAVPLTSDYPGTSKNPMYWNGRIYFLTDRDGTMNIWSMNASGSDLKQHTKMAGWDLEEADLDGGRIICKQGADLVLYDIASDRVEKPEISLVSDFEQKRIQWITDPKSRITSVDLSYKGDQVVLTSRGRVFSAPVDGSRWSEVTRKYGVRYKSAKYCNPQNELLMLSDESGEFELWKADLHGFNVPAQVTKGSKNLIVGFSSSPDGRYIVYNERDKRLLLYSKSSGASVAIAESPQGFQGPFSWSPDSRYLAFTDHGAGRTSSIVKLYDVTTGKIWQVSSERHESYTPRFSREGNWLYFISSRFFSTLVKSPWETSQNKQPEPYYEKTAGIFAVALKKNLEFPFRELTELSASRTDTAKKEPSKPAAGKTEKKAELPAKSTEIDFTDLANRLYVVPIKSADISDFNLNGDWLYWSEYNSSDNTENLNALKITNAKGNELVSITTSVNSFSLSGDGKKILIRDKNGIQVCSADGKKPDAKKDLVDLAKWSFSLDPAEDWKQMFRDAWRMGRDYFYDPNMHGVNWQQIYDKYYPLTDRITDRYELDDLLAQMISELSVLHSFVSGGDKRLTDNSVQNGYLGAILVKNEGKGGYLISHIYQADPDYPAELSPLAKPGSKMAEGDVIVAINGVSTLSVGHINELLANKADMQVRLKLVNAKGETYEEVVRPIPEMACSSLRYSEWEYTRRLETDRLSTGKIGYLHLRAMGAGDFDSFVKNFYPVLDKEGIIIDVRHNRGGNIDSWILEKLMRKAWFYWSSRTGDVYPNMQAAFPGHLVVLMDENTASDGEAFSEGFRRLGLGKLIGTRTWGGEVWLTQSNRLVDNGVATAPETGVFSPAGEWLIEGWGVEPDIRVDNLPAGSFKGEDAQLGAAIEHLQKLIREQPVVKPPVPKYPVKAFDYNKQ